MTARGSIRMRLAWIFLATSVALSCRGPESAAPAPSVTPAASPAPTIAVSDAVSDPSRLVGRWLRSDSSYTIAIAGATPDGKLDAQYLNPNPIHVSRAEWRSYAGKLLVLLELKDRNYPGNFYTLTYDPGSDSLSGIYHHLGLNQELEVAFSRVSQ